MIRNWIVLTAVCFAPAAGAGFAERPLKPSQYIAEQNKREEIHPKNLPAASRMYIMQNYAGAEILKAYKLLQEKATYAVKLNFEGRKLELLFDANGKFLRRA